ncbi:MAG TPA: glycoside hydrolase family 2 TIM barrel-domain containing protein, partial [Candidatus Dormibacteraeota bacterium]|nr:glycoside hydrolase family 2 TIM barrel-domain containing protein [Candidatus Dormibacteraeota bacterium]
MTLAFIGLALGLGCSRLSAARPQLDLTGTWDFYPDVGDAGLESMTVKPGTIRVPGAWQAQGYGKAGGTIPASLLEANTSPADHLRHNLTARCLYVRAVEVPAAWKGQRIFLAVRRVYTRADVRLNGKPIGEWAGFCSPFEFDVTDAITFGGRNQIVIGVDNRPRPGRDTYGTANWFGNWGGLGGAVCLEARSPCWVQDVFAMPRIADSQVQLRVTVRTARPDWPTGLGMTAELAPWNQPTARSGRAQQPVAPGNSPEITVDLPVSIAALHLWTPDDPFLYVASVRLLKDGQLLDEQQVRFGMREITAQGHKLFLNAKPLYLSGYGDDATEPITGMLPAEKGLYRKRLALMRSLGFNFVRHHSTVPHDEYLEAADEVGMLVQPEAGMAYTKFWPTGHQLFEREWPHIIRAFRNHPCIWAWCMGNELFLRELPERETGAHAVDLAEPLTNGPLQTVAQPDNGVYGPPG